MSTRRPARDQKLPQGEIDYILSLPETTQYVRLRKLYNIGWTLRALGEAYTPARARSTVRQMMDRAEGTLPPGAPTLPPPEYVTPPAYIRTTIPSPGISASEQAEIARLAPIARKFRAAHAPNHPASIANDEFTRLCQQLHAKGVTILELATAAEVSTRAMTRRLGKNG